ncbi:MAG: Threonine-tRNA ligase, partial [Parcubacteria group bacterium GW2011_GWB1_56_8]
WSRAESALEAALEHNKVPFEVKPKDGAFYGPKIDIHIKDALGRDWQLATIQLDLAMLPERFALSYADEKGKRQKPVVIHRAIFGSFERFIGILVEHFAGALPLWLSPVQAEVITVGSGQKKFAQEVWKNLQGHGVRARLSDENLTVGKRIREAEMQKIPYILVVGEKEEKNGTVNVRHYRRGPASADLTPAAASAKGVTMAGRQEGEMNLEKLLERIALEIAAKTI